MQVFLTFYLIILDVFTLKSLYLYEMAAWTQG